MATADPKGYDFDKLGIKFTKQRHELYLFDENIFSHAVSKVTQVLRSEGYEVSKVVFDPPREGWHFYDGEGGHVYTCPHDTIDTIWQLLTKDFSHYGDGA